MNPYLLQPSIEDLSRSVFVQDLSPKRQAELNDEIQYYERYLKNETSADIKETLGVTYSESWHKIKKIVATICSAYTSQHKLDRFDKTSFTNEYHISRLIDAISLQDGLREAIIQTENLKSYVRWLIMNHTRGNHAMVNKNNRMESRRNQPIALELDTNMIAASNMDARSHRNYQHHSNYGYGGYDSGMISPLASPRHRRDSGCMPYNGDPNRYSYQGSPEFEPLHQTQSHSSSSSYGGSQPPGSRRQSIMRITDILNTEGLGNYQG